MQRTPQTHRPQLFLRFQPIVAEIAHQFIRRQIDVIECRNPRRRVLHNLGPPPSLTSRIEPLATMETEFLPDGNEWLETLARAPIGVMVVIAPSQSQLLLPGVLHLRRSVLPLPIAS